MFMNHSFPLSTDKRHTPWTGMLLMDAKTCIQMEKICHDIFVSYRLGKCHDKFLPFTTVVAHVIGTHTRVAYIRVISLFPFRSWSLLTCEDAVGPHEAGCNIASQIHGQHTVD